MSTPLTPPTRRRHFEGARVSDRSRPGTSPAAARTGKANFDPYWKLSAVSGRTMAWQEARGTYWTAEAARGAAADVYGPGTVVRLIRLAPGLPGGREVVETFTV